uniref:Uncharacterized protein n=1 Tax=Myoviridae sp. ctEBR14 TaxID=2825060 RepID=A0A8S5NVP3_9CAUD|nr:MAG TPA: hypothetical protein [Myoviridae sp. ctEBR14]
MIKKSDEIKNTYTAIPRIIFIINIFITSH